VPNEPGEKSQHKGEWAEGQEPLAARHQPGFQGERLAKESDELGEGPDPEGPEGGA
jgi:hypothetical protein